MMKKQEYVPREVKERPLYELQSVEDIPASKLYRVKINGTEQKAYHTEFFDFVSFLGENGESDIEITVNENFENAVIRPTSARICFTREKDKIRFSLPAGGRAILELDDRLESPLYILSGKYVEKPENATYVFEGGKAYNIGCLQLKSEETVYIEAGDAIYSLVVTQAGGVEELATAAVTYLGNTMKIYDNGFTTFNEYLIALTSEDGNTTVNLAVNAADQEDYLAGVPAATYTVDVTGAHADNTFSLKPADGSERYYTSIIKDGAELEVLDGTIDIVNENGTYTITALLYDANGTASNFSYTGAIETIADASFAAVGGATFENNYNTYYASGANIWNLYFYVSKSPAEGVPYMDYICFDIAGESGTLSGDELPTGTFTLAVPTTITSGHPQGNLNAEPGSLIDEQVSSNDDAVIEGYNGNKCKFMEGSTVAISKNDDGTYNFVFDATIDRIDPTTESSIGTFEYEATFSNVEMPISKSTLVPSPDADTELTTGNFMGYQGFYLGNKWGVEGCHAFILYLVSLNNAYTMYLPVYIKGDYTFEANYSGIGCSNPLPEGTCTWSETPGENTLLPVVYSSNGTGASYRYSVSNGYTGTTLRPSGGSVTVTPSGITFDMDATTTDGETTYHFTGTVPITVQFMQDHSSVASRYYTLNEWKEHTAAQQ